MHMYGFLWSSMEKEKGDHFLLADFEEGLGGKGMWVNGCLDHALSLSLSLGLLVVGFIIIIIMHAGSFFPPSPPLPLIESLPVCHACFLLIIFYYTRPPTPTWIYKLRYLTHIPYYFFDNSGCHNFVELYFIFRTPCMNPLPNL